MNQGRNRLELSLAIIMTAFIRQIKEAAAGPRLFNSSTPSRAGDRKYRDTNKDNIVDVQDRRDHWKCQFEIHFWSE